MIQGIRYLDELLDEMAKHWPDNRTINIVCHGHSVPSGYFATPFVDTFNAYPHLLHKMVKERFPFAVVNVITTSIGGENSISGVKRFEADVLCHKPDLVVIDYALNDGIDDCYINAWAEMIEKCKENNIKVILCTPTFDNSYYLQNERWQLLITLAEEIRTLADKFDVGLADSFKAFERKITEPAELAGYLSHGNHPTRAGHKLVANEIAKYFIAR